MRNLSFFRKSLIATGIVVAVAAVPFSQAVAQQAASSSSSAMQSNGSMQSSNQTVPGKVDDTWITTKVKSELASAKNVKSADISVTTTEGVVALSGTVASAKQKAHVVHIAKNVKGVKSVDGSGLTVSAMPASASSSSTH
jgi:hyperosmotically inducible protein